MKASKFIILFISIVVLVVINLLLGTVRIPVGEVCSILMGAGSESEIWTNIVISSRLPQVLTAIVAGAGLSVSGLQMQTVFRNPLAGPSVLGISNGSALGVAFVVLLSGKIGGVALSRLGYLGDAAMSVAAIVGALAVMLLIVWISQKVKGNVTLLIIGVMIGYLANAIIGVLKFLSPEEDVKSFVVWGLGSFSRVSGDEMVLFVVLMCILLPISFLLVKPMNMLLLGERYAANLGLDVQRARMLIIICSGESRPRRTTGTHADYHLFGCLGGHRHRLLRTYHVHRTGRASFGACPIPHQRSPRTVTRHCLVWCSFGSGMQLHCPHAWLRGSPTRQ